MEFFNNITDDTGPFAFGKIVEDLFFTNREDDVLKLIQYFKASQSVILISPRRWGKSSLVKQASKVLILQNEDFRVVYLDVFSIRSEEEFYQLYAEKVLQASYSKWDELSQNIGSLFKSIFPKISYNPLPEQEFSVSFDWNDIKKNKHEILELPEIIAQKKGIKFLINIDEFQNIDVFDEPLAFQKLLRSYWQKQNLVSYCLYGSKENMMQTLFNKPSYPFYRFGHMFNIQKIKIEKWQVYINEKFENTKKKITEDHIKSICQKVELLPYYVQQLSQLVWNRTNKKCSEQIINDAFDDLLNQLSVFFMKETENLSNYQLNFLKSILDGNTRLTTYENIHKYHLASSANVVKVQKALIEKQILRKEGKKLEFVDPIYGHWVAKVMMHK